MSIPPEWLMQETSNKFERNLYDNQNSDLFDQILNKGRNLRSLENSSSLRDSNSRNSLSDSGGIQEKYDDLVNIKPVYISPNMNSYISDLPEDDDPQKELDIIYEVNESQMGDDKSRASKSKNQSLINKTYEDFDKTEKSSNLIDESFRSMMKDKTKVPIILDTIDFEDLKMDDFDQVDFKKNVSTFDDPQFSEQSLNEDSVRSENYRKKSSVVNLSDQHEDFAEVDSAKFSQPDSNYRTMRDDSIKDMHHGINSYISNEKDQLDEKVSDLQIDSALIDRLLCDLDKANMEIYQRIC